MACAVLHNICIDMNDELPPEDYDNENNDIAVDNLSNLPIVTRGRQERDCLIRDYFGNL